MKEYDFSGEFPLSDVKRNFSRLVNGDNPFKVNRSMAQGLLQEWQNGGGFYGASLTQAQEWAEKGYTLKGSERSPALVPQANKRKFHRADEGELILEAAYNGEDFPFLQQSQRPAKPGLRIVAEFGVRGSTPPEAVAQYGRFIGELAVFYQHKGYDLALSLVMPGSNRFSSVSGTSQTIVILKREGIIADPIEWSVMFSPVGYRMFGFLSHTMLAESHKQTVSSGMGGSCNSGEFDAKFDRLSRTLTIEAESSFREFPTAKMREKIERLGI